MSQNLSFLITKASLLLPDLKGSFLFLFNSSSQKVPSSVNRTGLVLVSVHFIVEVLAPSVENAGLNLVTLYHVREVHVLVSKCQRLECTDIPLLQSHFLPIHSNFVANHTEGFQLVMTILIKIGILVQFSKRLTHLQLLLFQNKLIQ